MFFPNSNFRLHRHHLDQRDQPRRCDHCNPNSGAGRCWSTQRMGLSQLWGLPWGMRAWHRHFWSSTLLRCSKNWQLTFQSVHFYTIFTLFIHFHLQDICSCISSLFWQPSIVLFHSWPMWRFFIHVPFVSAEEQFLLNCYGWAKMLRHSSHSLPKQFQVEKQPLTKKSESTVFYSKIAKSKRFSA